MDWNKELLQAEQMRLEKAAFDGGVARYQSQQQRIVDQGEASDSKPNKRLIQDLIDPMAKASQAYVEHYRSRRGNVAKSVPFMECVPPVNLAYITIKTALDMLPNDTSLQSVAIKIGSRIEDQARFSKVDAVAPKYLEAVRKSLLRAFSKKYKHQRAVLAKAERAVSEATGSYAVDIDRWIAWPKSDLLHLGFTMIEVMQESLSYDGEPVFRIARPTARDTYRLEISAKVSGWCNEFSEFIKQMAPEYTPCVVPPRDWTSPTSGGYFMPEVARTLPLVKVRNRKHLKLLSYEQMPEVYEAVNNLQRVPWEINKEVLNVAREVQSRDLCIGMPQADPLRPEQAPVRPELDGLRGKDLYDQLTPDEEVEFKQWKNDARDIYEAENTRASKYMTCTRTVTSAERFARYPEFYFVYTLDSRSRVYCRASTFSPQGADLQKSLVRFARSEKLGDEGRDWLAVHGANVWGADKKPFAERIALMDEMQETIRDIAADPLTFRAWADADEPWQFLAWALEWNELLEWTDVGKLASEFPSKTAVAQDGSCSGIQHYSALLKDKRGGSAVNLTDSGKPEDIYNEVADVSKAMMQRIVKGEEKLEIKAKDDDVSDACIAKACEAWTSLLTRTLTKPSVMTLPYGSSVSSCRESIFEYLKDLESKEAMQAKAAGRGLNPVHPFMGENPLVSKDLAVAICTKVVWASIGEVVVAAREGMSFIRKVAGKVAKADKGLLWTTPTGFIVEQAIYNTQSRRVYTYLMGKTSFTIREEMDSIDVAGMRSSSAPNFIHSMDASHLIKSVNSFADSGMKGIAVIHDSFGTHAGKTGDLRRILREEMVQMYQHNWLETFKQSAEYILGEEIKEEAPYVGTLDLNEILESTYAFA